MFDDTFDNTPPDVPLEATGVGTHEVTYYGNVRVDEYDFDGDGHADLYTADNDADGTPEVLARDTDGDGLLDETRYDENENGVPERIVRDTDHDGVLDQWDYDRDEDGQIDDSYHDTDGDGRPDLHTTTHVRPRLFP